MEAYTGFAEVYDTFMDNVPYEEWGAYLCGLLEEYGMRHRKPDRAFGKSRI